MAIHTAEDLRKALDRQRRDESFECEAVMRMTADQFFASEERHVKYDKWYRSKELELEKELVANGVLK